MTHATALACRSPRSPEIASSRPAGRSSVCPAPLIGGDHGERITMACSIWDESPSRVVLGALLLWAIACSIAHADSADWHVSMGPGLVIAPEYPGSEDEKVLPIPALDIRYRSLFLDWRRGLGGFLVNDERQQL